jgi:hypothetical protein
MEDWQNSDWFKAWLKLARKGKAGARFLVS